MASIEWTQILAVTKYIVASIGALVIIWGAIWSTIQFAMGKGKDGGIDKIRLNFGRLIVLGLEFIVAADVISTISAPDYYNLGILASLVVIRTLLTYFMNRELSTLKRGK